MAENNPLVFLEIPFQELLVYTWTAAVLPLISSQTVELYSSCSLALVKDKTEKQQVRSLLQF